MRPSAALGIWALLVVVAGGILATRIAEKRAAIAGWEESRNVVEAFGLSDLAVTTEARYTRHPAVTDPLVPFMDHPGGLEHFPSGSFSAPVQP
ncbi:hypothetical protein [Desulfopila aestuarii]|uniref:Uncharacterized protein n=1 Tax=Desulfopila aestuarii DSM 18488 TaxID=1121416 RepID=A0A1M7XZG7_9BACT|nr:hypothetical protein [Desulfopila aestuarii]SHO44541.1 hypothetical protein SAMN02745220_00789 [Desulfopila aestuarii DSM 18488]